MGQAQLSRHHRAWHACHLGQQPLAPETYVVAMSKATKAVSKKEHTSVEAAAAAAFFAGAALGAALGLGSTKGMPKRSARFLRFAVSSSSSTGGAAGFSAVEIGAAAAAGALLAGFAAALEAGLVAAGLTAAAEADLGAALEAGLVVGAGV